MYAASNSSYFPLSEIGSPFESTTTRPTCWTTTPRPGTVDRLRTPVSVVVPAAKSDGTITGLGDVDYLCEAERVSEPGYWVATDGSKITGRQSMG
jgi:hypothetical protein